MNSSDCAQVLLDLNRTAVEFGSDALTTAVVAAFYRKDRHLYFSYAGHHEFLLNRKGDDEWDSLAAAECTGLAGLLLGVDGDTRYEQTSFPLSAGDRLFLYTDGVIESPNRDGESFGEVRLRETLKACRGMSLGSIRSSVLTAVLHHTGNNLGHDDVTFMAIEILE